MTTPREIFMDAACGASRTDRGLEAGADAFFAALDAAGFAIVPKEPSEEIIDANCDDGFGPVNVAGPYVPHVLHQDVQMNRFYLNIPQLERMYRAMVSVAARSLKEPSDE